MTWSWKVFSASLGKHPSKVYTCRRKKHIIERSVAVSSPTYLWASALPEEMWSRRKRAQTKVNGCMLWPWEASFPTGLDLVAVSSNYSSWGLMLIKKRRQERVLHKARRISCISRAQSQSFLQGKRKSLSHSLQCCTFSLRPIILLLLFLPLWDSRGGLTLKWNCTLRDRFWLLEVGVGL